MAKGLFATPTTVDLQMSPADLVDLTYMDVYLQAKPSGIAMQENTDGTVSIAVTGSVAVQTCFMACPDQRHSGRCGRCVVINV